MMNRLPFSCSNDCEGGQEPGASRVQSVAPRLSHPLSGASLRLLLHLLRDSGGVVPARLPQVAFALGAAVTRWPFSAAERLYVACGRRSLERQPPIFIVGHWRSGTTHLSNIMSEAGYGIVTPIAAGIPWDFLLLGRLLRPLLERLLPHDRFIDAMPVRPDLPQEDEVALACMSPVSFLHALYFPKRFEYHFDRGVFLERCSAREIAAWQEARLYFLDKVAIAQRGRTLLIKNPADTARVGRLHALMPGAKFIHIHRNPFAVFLSMRRFYAGLFQQYALQRFEHLAIDDLILSAYPKMMDRLFAEAGHLPPGHFAELSYEALKDDPLAELERIYAALSLRDFRKHRPRFEAHLNSVKDYRPARYVYDEDDARLVEHHWRRFFERWGYPLPTQGVLNPEAGPASPCSGFRPRVRAR